MNKISKIFLPIATTCATIAPVACLTSCGIMKETSITRNVVFNKGAFPCQYKTNASPDVYNNPTMTIVSQPSCLEGKILVPGCTIAQGENGFVLGIVLFIPDIGETQLNKGDKFVFEVTFVKKGEEDMGKDKKVSLTLIHDPDANK